MRCGDCWFTFCILRERSDKTADLKYIWESCIKRFSCSGFDKQKPFKIEFNGSFACFGQCGSFGGNWPHFMPFCVNKGARNLIFLWQPLSSCNHIILRAELKKIIIKYFVIRNKIRAASVQSQKSFSSPNLSALTTCFLRISVHGRLLYFFILFWRILPTSRYSFSFVFLFFFFSSPQLSESFCKSKSSSEKQAQADMTGKIANSNDDVNISSINVSLGRRSWGPDFQILRPQSQKVLGTVKIFLWSTFVAHWDDSLWVCACQWHQKTWH